MNLKLNKNQIERFSRQIILKDVGTLGQKKIINQWLLFFQVMVNGQPTGIALMDLVDQQITCQQLENVKKKQV